MARASDSSTSSSDLPRDRRLRTGWAWSLLGCAFVLGAAVGFLQGARTTLVEQALGDVAVRACWTVSDRIDAWNKRAPQAGELRGIVFGDSVFLTTFDPGKAFTPVLSRVLTSPGRSVALLDLTHLGFSAFQFYYLTDRAVARQPRFAVVEVNLRTFADDWQQTGWLRFPQLAGGLSLRQAWEVRTELATQSLSPLAPLVYRLQEKTGSLFVFDGLRRVGTRALQAAGTDMNAVFGLAARSHDETRIRILQQNLVLDTERAAAWYGRDFANTPSAGMLQALARALRAADVETFFVVAPMNRERLAQLGISLADLGARIEQLRLTIGGPQRAWIDLSAQYTSRDFVDAVHLRPVGVEGLAANVGEEIKQQIEEYWAVDGDPRATPRRGDDA